VAVNLADLPDLVTPSDLGDDLPTSVATIEPRHIEDWIGSILETSKPATAHNRWRGLQRFFDW